MSIRFLTTLVAEQLLARDPDTGLSQWRLLAPLIAVDGVGVGSRRYTIPAGYITDLASIPRAARVFFDPTDPKAARAAVLHDWLYSNRGCVESDRMETREDGRIVIAASMLAMTRAEADRLFYRALRDGGVSWVRSRLYLLAVRIGGQAAWDSPA